MLTQHIVILLKPPARKTITAHRLEQNWLYIYAVDFRRLECSLKMVCGNPADVGA
jgi:hypothetical protein